MDRDEDAIDVEPLEQPAVAATSVSLAKQLPPTAEEVLNMALAVEALADRLPEYSSAQGTVRYAGSQLRSAIGHLL